MQGCKSGIEQSGVEHVGDGSGSQNGAMVGDGGRMEEVDG